MRYGTRAMLDIAINYEKSPVSVKSLSQRQNISVKYMEKLIHLLKIAGLIKSIRGSEGGYTLNKNTDQIKLRDIIDALEGSMFHVDCVDNPKTCNRAEKCVTYEIWKDIQDIINNMLDSLTLADMVERQLKINSINPLPEK